MKTQTARVEGALPDSNDARAGVEPGSFRSDVYNAPAATDERALVGLPRGALPAAPPAFLVRAAMRVRKVLLRCADAVTPAHVVLLEHGFALTHSLQLGAVARKRIADVLQGGPLSARELAERTGCDEDALHRTLRSLASLGVFSLDGQGRFSNNRLSRALCSQQRNRVSAMLEYFASASNIAAWVDFPRTLATGRNAFARMHGLNVWEWFAAHPAEEMTFADAMLGVTFNDAPFIAALYPFPEIRCLCDVGGGRAALLSELLLRHPHLRGLLYEASSVIPAARGLLEQRGVADRVECVAGSFFDEVPSGCDAYLLKSVLHDWDDAHVRRILANVRRAIPAGGRLLLVEMILERNERSQPAAGIDVHMMVVCQDGRERSQADFEALLTASGFRLARVFRGPMLAVLEALPV
ncbi:MAG: methyltransferase [Deltaproteobacteria bacterium]